MATQSAARQALRTALTYATHTKAARFTKPLSIERRTAQAREILRAAGLVSR